MKHLLYFLCFILYCSENVNSRGLNEEFTWTRISYSLPRSKRAVKKEFQSSPITFPGDTNSDQISHINSGTGKRNQSSNSGQINEVTETNVDYIYQNNIPMGANIWKDKLFITVPRRRLGVPSTLNYVSLGSTNKHNVPLIPYPDLLTNAFETSRTRENRFVSVYRVAVDPCDRLWFVDTGLVEIPGNATRLQPTTLFIIDLNTDRIIRRYTFKDSDLRSSTTLANLEIDVTSNTCEDAFAYIPDLAGYGLIVYSFRENESWRVNHNYFYLESLAGEFHVAGLNFQWNDGIFSISLTEEKFDGSRDAYFHSMAGTHLFRVSTKILRNESLATRSYHENDFQDLGDRGALAQTSASDLHQPSGIIFLGLVNQNALGCFSTNKGFRLSNFDIVQQDDEKMIYPCDVKIRNDDVILLTNNMPIFLYSTLNYDQINFRVWIQNVTTAVKDTRCAQI